MSDIAIRVENISKLYRIGIRERYSSLRDSLMRSFSSVAKKMKIGGNEEDTADPAKLWALHDVSFDVEKGQALGIIGANGAGKSTLLKILSRITDPTSGRAEIRGRMGSLLEVGTGFHPELTGRDNIYLSGIILGMRRWEIKRRFDEIVAFAEMGQFIDTPVKFYSSGMYVRLAFSVAAHLDVDVLAVDEVLAVGDAAFQKKCLGKMDETMSNQGRTILFVSHNLGAMKYLTTKCILLQRGKLTKQGDTETVIQTYLKDSLSAEGQGKVDLTHPDLRRGTAKKPELNMTFRELTLSNDAGNLTNVFFEGDPINVELTIESKIEASVAEIIIVLLSFEGTVLLSAFSRDRFKQVKPGLYKAKCRFDPNPFRAGYYRIRLYLKSGHWQDVISEALSFKIELNPQEEGEIGYAMTHPALMGLIRTSYEWEPVKKV